MSKLKTQMNMSLSQDWYDRLPGLLEQIRSRLGMPGLSFSEICVMGLQVLAQWSEHVAAARPEILARIEPPRVPDGRQRAPGGGRKRKPKTEEV